MISSIQYGTGSDGDATGGVGSTLHGPEMWFTDRERRNAPTLPPVPFAMDLFITPAAVELIRRRGGVAAIDFIPPIG